jgi:hypothetical protein
MADAPDKGRLWLFTNTYKQTDKHPSFTGSGEISLDVLKRIVDVAKTDPPADGLIKLQCAAWEKISKGNKQYLFTTFDLKEDRPGDGGKPDGNTDGQKGTDDAPAPWDN